MTPEIKRLYDEANQLHVRAKGILDEYKGKDLPGDKATEVDTLLDQVEAKSAEAKRLHRADGVRHFFFVGSAKHTPLFHFQNERAPFFSIGFHHCFI